MYKTIVIEYLLGIFSKGTMTRNFLILCISMHPSFTELHIVFIYDGHFPSIFSAHQRPNTMDRYNKQKEKIFFTNVSKSI